MTNMWQEERGKKYYRFQTDEIDIANRMKRRKKFILVGWGDNCELWIFQAIFSRPDIARNAFKSIMGGRIEFDDKKEIFFSEGILSSPPKKAA
jgi:hypothetical protein